MTTNPLRHGCSESTFTTMKAETIYDGNALPEDRRRVELIRLTREGLGLSPGELKEVLDPAYDLGAMRRADVPDYAGER